MAAVGDKVFYYKFDQDGVTLLSILAMITAFEPAGAVLLLMGNKFLGYVTAPEAEEPTNGSWVAP